MNWFDSIFNFNFLNDTYVSIFYLFFLSNQSSLEVWQASNQFQGSNRTQLKPIHSNAGTLHKIKMPLVEKRERKRYKKENIRRSLNVIRTYDRWCQDQSGESGQSSLNDYRTSLAVKIEYVPLAALPDKNLRVASPKEKRLPFLC